MSLTQRGRALVSGGEPFAPFRKIWSILDRTQKKRAVVLLPLLLLGMVFEVFGVTLVIPVIALLINPDATEKYALLDSMVDALGNPSHNVIVAGTI